MIKMKQVSIIGLGYVGLPLAILADRKGYNVIGIDKDEEKVELINLRKCPFREPEIERKLQSAKLIATENIEKIENSSIIVICVPTPVDHNYHPDLEPIRIACSDIAPFLEKEQLIILESTVNPGVCEKFILPILESSGLKGGEDFYLAHCPERINPGDRKWNVENIPRVLGGLEEISLKKAYQFYNSILKSEIKPMQTLQEAEAVKIVENSFRDINIAFVNELARSFQKLKIDILHVIDGANTKPFSFMPHYPGCGVGGHCIPVDPYYLIEYAEQNGFHHDLLAWARRVNNNMPEYTVERAVDGLNNAKIAINGTKIVVLGLSYKANVDDTRESPSFEIIKHLNEFGAEVSYFDPYLPQKSSADNMDDAMKGSEAVIVATAHNYFKEELTPAYLLAHKIKVLVDGRNCLKKEDFERAGIIYRGIGR